jgi:hypothetical protein
LTDFQAEPHGDWTTQRLRFKPARSHLLAFSIAGHSPSSIYRTNNLPLGPNRVIHVMTALSAALRKANMKTFMMDTDNNIAAHAR